jgi:hypothetical protein
MTFETSFVGAPSEGSLNTDAQPFLVGLRRCFTVIKEDTVLATQWNAVRLRVPGRGGEAVVYHRQPRAQGRRAVTDRLGVQFAN